jgi:hypothetical protein
MSFVDVEIRLAAAGLGWKSVEGDETVTVPADSIKYIQWIRLAKHHPSPSKDGDRLSGFLQSGERLSASDSLEQGPKEGNFRWLPARGEPLDASCGLETSSDQRAP